MDTLTLLPPVLALIIAVATRNVFYALGGAIWASETIIAGGNPLLGLLGSVDRAASVFESAGNTRILLFCLIIGALIAYMQRSGGVAALVNRLVTSGLASTPRRAGLVTALTGSALFMETNVSLLTTGIMGRPLFDRLKISRERLAYLIDSTSAPISILVLINGWGAYLFSLISEYGFDDPIAIIAATIPLNFYALLTLAGVYLTVFSGKVIGPMRTAETRIETDATDTETPTRAIYMALPLAIMVIGTLGFMLWTGNGNMMAGSGSQSILWAVIIATGVAFLLLRLSGRFQTDGLIDMGFKGMGELLPAVAVIFLSLALGNSLRALGTGEYIAALASSFPAPVAIPAILFAAAAITSFTTGTSWGTYGILVPIAMPLAIGAGVPPALALAAVMGGGVFGDHCSPISDTSIIASFAAGCDHISHVRTQLPYALLAAAGATALYLGAGAIMIG
ncbi:MAG: Na+/H+ antiporter NhaC family protein [Pseudomonadota bacterium]